MKYLVWIEVRKLKTRPFLLVPGWTGFNIIVRNGIVVVESVISYLDTIDSPATDMKTAYEVLCRDCEIRERLNLWAVAFYAKVMDIYWKHKDMFKNLIIMLGGFHLLMLFGVIGARCVGEGRKLPLSSAPRPIQSYISNKRRPTLHTRSRNAANLVNICCDPYVKDVDTNTTLSVCLVNTRSIRNKIAEFADYVSETKLDLYAVTETWLMVNDDSIRAQLCPTGYKLLDKPREGHRGGGTALFYKDSFTVSMVNCRRVESFEYLEVLVSLSSSSNLRVVIVYRRPYSDEHKVSFDVFINEFSNYLESVVLSKENLLIIGDFNIHMDVPSDTKTNRFLDLLESLGLQQHVDKPTHIHGHILDLVITRKARTIINTPPVIDTFFSDHASIVCKIQTRKPAPKAKVVTFRKFKSIDMDSFHDDLASSDLCTTKYDVRIK